MPEDRALQAYALISRADLPQLELEHLCSEVDETIGLPERFAALSAELISGFTEWVATWRGKQVSVGWDWVAVHGDIQMLQPTEIRTNIRLIAEDGSPESALLTRLHLAEWLETVPWRTGAISDLVRAQGNSSA